METPVSYTHLDVYKRQDMKTADYRGIMFNFGNEYWPVSYTHLMVVQTQYGVSAAPQK